MKVGSVIGQTLDGKYKIEKQLGKGGMGTVYLATHIGTERAVAVKVIAWEFMQRAEFVERFRREARAAGRLRHPNVVDVTDFGFSETRDGQVAYLVMEYLDGCTLGEILEEEKKLPLSWIVDILDQVCSAVHEAHLQGIIHRDLKPDNIWLEPNQRGGYTVKVLDFGIAKLEENEAVAMSDLESEFSIEEPGDPDTTDRKQTRTFFDAENSTFISESNTVVQPCDDNVHSGRGTIAIQPRSNDETSAFDAGTIIQDQNLSEGSTKLISSEENTSTRLISNPDEQIGSRAFVATTDKSRLDTPRTAELTRVGAVLGTPLYMSPEQCRGEKLTAHSDVYSLGVIVYQMLSGNTPFEGNHTEVMDSHKSKDPPMIDARKIPKRVKKVVNASLAKDPADRPQTAEGFANELRSSSEGLGTLLQRSMVIYSERLPKFLQIAFILAIPSILLTIAGVALRFLVAAEILPAGIVSNILDGSIGLATFFVQIFYAALLVGMTTWIVAQVLAAPLRPISVKSAFGQVRLRLKALLKTVTASTLLSLLSWVMGGIAGAVISGIFALPIYYFTGNGGLAAGVAIVFGFLGALVLGVGISSGFMLIAPSIMMEGVTGRAAFRRSIELVRRSYRTVLATAILVYVVPMVLALTIAMVISGLISKFDPQPIAETPAAVAEQPAEAGNNSPDESRSKGGFSFGKRGFNFSSAEEPADTTEKSMANNLRTALKQGTFELIWSPLVILLSSFTSVLTALLYFKTRQAGGESMLGLLRQFEEAECSTSKWRTRVRRKLLQSGRTTGGRKFTPG